MNIVGTTKLTVISKNQTTSKEGKPYYKLGIISGTEVGMLSCSEEIFNQAQEGKTFEVETIYNDTYKSFRINRLLTSGK